MKYSSIFRHCEAVSSLISKHPILFVLFFVKPQSLADNAKEMWVLLISLYLKMDINKQSTSEMLDWFRICVIFTWTSIPKVQEIWPPEAAIFSSIYKCQINIQLQGCGTVGALMGIYLEGIFTTKADIEDDIHAYRHHDISLSSWSQDQALFFTAVITPWDFETANRQSFLTCISFPIPLST